MTRPACGPLVGTKCASRYLAAGTRARAIAVAVAVAVVVVVAVAVAVVVVVAVAVVVAIAVVVSSSPPPPLAARSRSRSRAESLPSANAAPTSSNGFVVPLPSLTSAAPSNRAFPTYASAVLGVGTFGLGGIHGSLVSSHVIPRRQPRIGTIVKRAGFFDASGWS